MTYILTHRIEELKSDVSDLEHLESAADQTRSKIQLTIQQAEAATKALEEVRFSKAVCNPSDGIGEWSCCV